MNNSNMIWLASYPRSGNTLLRTIIWHCFGIRSASFYPNDLGGNKALEEYVGHIEHGPNYEEQLSQSHLPIIKTHEYPQDNRPAIYIIRDGRAACVSLWKFYNKAIPLDATINGEHQFGSWADHIEAWDPWNRPNTLLIEYQDMVDRLPKVLQQLSQFLDREILQQKIPHRNDISDIDGRYVKKKRSWKTDLNGEELKSFNKHNKVMLKKAGYL